MTFSTFSKKTRWLTVIIIAILVGFVGGFFVGRALLERQWAEPRLVLSGTDARQTAKDDPMPPTGARVFRPMPLQRTRLAIANLARRDPLIVPVASVGRNGTDTELHVVVKNQGTCTVAAFSGVAYGFDATGRPSPMNRYGQSYVAFTDQGRAIEPGASFQSATPLRYVETASIAVAHIDELTCAEGTTWRRHENVF